MNTALLAPFNVAKFGGTSVADYHSMCRCADIVTSDPTTNVVVVSASAGVTNLLIALAEGRAPEIRKQHLHKIAAIQHAILAELPENTALRIAIDRLINNISVLAEAASLATSTALTDELVSHGELLSSSLFTEILKQKHDSVMWFDSRHVIRTDNNFGKATPQIKEIKQLCCAYLKSHLVDRIVVIPGFIGSDVQGRTTTLGRGGSDYSAALLGEALGASKITIWSDVAGIYTTDPKIVVSAKRIDEITFLEAAEMATFGAKILHPATLLPALRCNIPVFIGSSHEKEAGGTLVCHTNSCRSALPHFRAITVRRRQILLTLRSLNERNSPTFLAAVFAIMAKYHITIDFVSTSEVSIALTLDPSSNITSGNSALKDEVLNELAELCHVDVEENLALVALIGNHLSKTKGVMSTVFDALPAFSIRLSCCGASTNSLCFLVNEHDANHIVSALHLRLFE